MGFLGFEIVKVEDGKSSEADYGLGIVDGDPATDAEAGELYLSMRTRTGLVVPEMEPLLDEADRVPVRNARELALEALARRLQSLRRGANKSQR